MTDEDTTVHMTHRPAELTPDARSAPTLRTTTLGGTTVGETVQPSTPATAEFQMLEKLGQGGMGAVFRARQEGLAREVAVKIALSSDAADRARFVAEARISGRLEHANIVPVHALEQNEQGAPYLAMKLVRGVSWRALLARTGPDRPALRENLRILVAVSHAIEYAHEQGVLHRDLKPENVMVGEHGQVFVVDWGVACALVEEVARSSGVAHISSVRAPAGTPVYMAPELATGDGASQDARTDVYLLGACLHEVLSGEPRHRGKTLPAVLASAILSAPCVHDASVPRELAVICAKATAAARTERFPTARAFREAIEGFLEHAEAAELAVKGVTLASDLERKTAERARAATADERDVLEEEMDALDARARFALEHALERWPGCTEARAGLARVARARLEHALAKEDVALARKLLRECPDESGALAARVAALEERIAARERELAVLRDDAKRRDWSVVAPALGAAFVTIGVLTIAGTAVSFLVRRADLRAEEPLILTGLWAALVIASALVVRARLRDVGVPRSIAARQLVGTWAAVGAASAAVMTIGWILGLPPFALLGVVAVLLGLGIAIVAFATRSWLLLPAAALAVAGLLVAARPDDAREILGLAFGVVLAGTGLALRLGKSLESRD